MARRGADDISPPARGSLPRPADRTAGAHGEALGGHAAHRARAHARRSPDRVLQREELLFCRSLPSRRGDRQGHPPAREVHPLEQLREPALHLFRRLLLARRPLFRNRGEAQGSRRPRHSGHQEGRGGPAYPHPAERPHDALLVAGREAAGVHRIRRRFVGPVRGQRGRLESPPPHARQVRGSPAVVVARREDDRVRDRPRPGDELRRSQVRQHADRAVSPRQGHDRAPRSHGRRQEHQSRLGAGRTVAGLRVGPERHQQPVSL